MLTLFQVGRMLCESDVDLGKWQRKGLRHRAIEWADSRLRLVSRHIYDNVVCGYFAQRAIDSVSLAFDETSWGRVYWECAKTWEDN